MTTSRPPAVLRAAAVGIIALRVLVVMAFSSSRDVDAAAAGYMACPTDCSCLGNMVDCSKKKLKRFPDDLPSWVQILDISSNAIGHLNVDQFKGLDHLEEINLNDNKLTNFDATIFHHLPSLHILKLSYNRLTSVPHIGRPTNITHLVLSHNVITHVDSLTLRNLESLRSIDLSFNAITHLKNGTFSPLKSLHHLFLTDNKIESIERGCFDNLTSLEWLKLNKNKLSSLPSNLFSRLQKLKYLELNQNRLRKIEGLRFQGLSNLLSLRLRRNSLSELMDGAFWGLSKIQTLQLDFNNLSRINNGFLFGLETMEHLSVSHNTIVHIEPDSWSSCKRLSELDLSHNHLNAITISMFTKLESLQTLRLSHNRISYVAENSFRDLNGLKTLELNHNELSSTLEDASSAFTSLTSLTRLSLDGNEIKSIAKRSFEGLHQLKQLNLLDNAVTSVQDNAFEPLKNLEQLRFNSTSFLCDCHLSWLPVWLRGTGFQVNVHAECGHPENIRGQSVLVVDENDFKCNDFPKPVIIKDPVSQIALKDGILNLTCVAATSSDTKLRIEWKKDHMSLSNALVETTARMNSKDGLIEFTSLLTMRPVKNEHAGHYQCVASNVLGTSYSAKADITVSVYPRFLKTPSDVTVKAGSTARLECAASGQPTPEIGWQKDGGDDFPAARERRMHVMPSDDVFFIVEVKSEDQGVYTCTAKNDAGSVKANSTLTVLQAPSFAKTSREKVATEGETTVLECMSSHPGGRPRLEWLKEGRPLPMTSRHYFAADGQLLVITRTEMSDSGEYTCVMANSLGSERATSYFRVIGSSSSSVNASHESSGSRGDDLMHVSVIVIAVVVCVVGTSLVWVIVIYRIRLKREEYGSTTTDETTIAGDMTTSPFHATHDAAIFKRPQSSPLLCSHGRRDVVADVGGSSCEIHGTKRLQLDKNHKCSTSLDCYLYNSCRCQDSGCFCTDLRTADKSSHSRMPVMDGNDSEKRKNCRRQPVTDRHHQSTMSLPVVYNTASSSPSSSAHRFLPVSSHACRPSDDAAGEAAVAAGGRGKNVNSKDSSIGWRTASDGDLSSMIHFHLYSDSYSKSCHDYEQRSRSLKTNRKQTPTTTTHGNGLAKTSPNVVVVRDAGATTEQSVKSRPVVVDV